MVLSWFFAVRYYYDNLVSKHPITKFKKIFIK